jgi:hypothetical protein
VLIIGDIHRNYPEYLSLLARFPGEASIQIGDFGIFREEHNIDDKMPEDAWFFRGNHDNPELCHESSHYLGDFGYVTVGGVNVFHVAGAYSIDQFWRTEGVSWWRDEEMSVQTLNRVFDLYLEIKPDIVLSHDGPKQATDAMLSTVSAHKEYIPTRTDQALSAMFAAHQPKQWFFGHWHIDWVGQIGRTQFRCLPELGWAQIGNEEAA